ncbi:MAG: MaoC family dehydratase [Anaerolineae bacterium]
MSQQPYFDDVQEGQEIPPLEKQVTMINLLMYLGTVWLTDRIHYDHLYATQRRGLPGVVAPGTLGFDYYAQLLTDWASEGGELRQLSVQYRHFMVAGDTLRCGGKVTRKYVQDNHGYVELELWMNNPSGINCAPGKGVVELPVRGR